MKRIFLTALILFSAVYAYAQDTASYSKQDLLNIIKEVNKRDSSVEMQNMISRSREIEERYKEIRKSYAGKTDSVSINELKNLSNTYSDSVLKIFNLNADSLKIFRKDFTIAENLIIQNIGAYKQINFLMCEKIVPSLCRYLKEFYDRYNFMLKKYFSNN